MSSYRTISWCLAVLAGVIAVPAIAAASAGPGGEGPAGPAARMPGGRVAVAPRVTSTQVANGCPSAGSGPNFYAPGSGKTVALTFDDGPGPTTAGILAVLQSYGVPATFFNIGENAAARPDLVHLEIGNGEIVGNHTWNHPDMTTLSASQQAQEMDEATAEQQKIIGYGPCVFRPPYGSYNSTTLSLAQQRNMNVWLWSVDTEDWKANGSSSSYWVHRIISLAESEGGSQTHPVVLMHNMPSGNPATLLALPTIIKYFRSHGYTFVNLNGDTGLGYDLLTSNGGVHNFGAPWYGSGAGRLGPGVKAVGLAADPGTGGYWILKSNGGVDNFHAPWYGSMIGRLPQGQAVTAIAADAGGYLVLTSNGGVHNFGAPWYGSDAGRLGPGVTAAGLAVDPRTGGYWILKSRGGVDNFNAPWYGSIAGTHLTLTGLAATSRGGYLILSSNGGVHNFGTPWYGSPAGTLGSVTAVAIGAAAPTGGYWILKSNGGVDNYNAPWHGSMIGHVPSGQAVMALTGT